MNEIVKYDNGMNKLNFTGFSKLDMNMLMALCSKMRDKDVNEITFDFTTLKELMNYKSTDKADFIADLKRMNKRLMKVNCEIITQSEIIMFVLFPTFRVNSDAETLTVGVNKDFTFLLNELREYTRFDLDEFINLNSKYAKHLYRLLKQFRTQGWYRVKVNEFREKMDCPSSYSNKIFMHDIVNPSVEALKPYFKGLSVEVEKDTRKRGRPIIGYYFTFQKEHIPENDQIDGQMSITDFPETLPDKPKKKSGSSGFQSRKYDYDELEKQLLNKK